MQRKIIWIKVLIFGILINSFACKKTVDKRKVIECYYINESSKDITIEVFYKTGTGYLDSIYTLPNGGNLSQKTDLMAGSVSDLIVNGDSVTVKFGNEKISKFTPLTPSPYNILDFNNYQHTEKSEYKDTYKYTFTNDDYQYADDL